MQTLWIQSKDGRLRLALCADLHLHRSGHGYDHGCCERIDQPLTSSGRSPAWLSKDQDAALWRPHCAAVAEIFKAYDCLRLVKFDLKSYHAWLDGREDSEAMRGMWAAESAT